MNDRPLRVCHLGKYYPPAMGGMEGHVQLLAREQAARGVDVTVACVNHRNEAGDDVTWRPLASTKTVEETDGSVRIIRVGRKASLARFDVCPRLPNLLRRLAGESDLFHLHSPNPSMLLALTVWARRVPLVITHHSDVIRQKLLGLAFRVFERRIYRRALAIFPTSPEYAGGSALLQHVADRVRSLPLGIDLQPFLEPSSDSLKVAADWKKRYGEPLWLCVGRLVYYKGFENAIRALARVQGRLLVIGVGPLETSLKTLAQEVGVADRVVWCGSVDDATLAGAYRAATALWFPSVARSEGFGLVQVEAMASGCPVINTRVPHSGVPWVSRHEREGLTVAMDDPAALAAAAHRLLDEPALRDRLVAAARERAVAEFDYRIMAGRSLEFYSSLGISTHGQLKS